MKPNYKNEKNTQRLPRKSNCLSPTLHCRTTGSVWKENAESRKRKADETRLVGVASVASVGRRGSIGTCGTLVAGDASQAQAAGVEPAVVISDLCFSYRTYTGMKRARPVM